MDMMFLDEVRPTLPSAFVYMLLHNHMPTNNTDHIPRNRHTRACVQARGPQQVAIPKRRSIQYRQRLDDRALGRPAMPAEPLRRRGHPCVWRWCSGAKHCPQLFDDCIQSPTGDRGKVRLLCIFCNVDKQRIK